MRRLVGLAVVATVLAACGGGDADVATVASPADETRAAATASQLDPGTEASVDGIADDATWTAFDGERDLDVGHGVRTDATGFAEIVYADGSLTRLDVETTLELVALAEVAARTADVVVGLDVGRTWHRVQSIDGGGRFEVRTSVATAAVRGTAFVVDCAPDGACLFLVVEGTVEVTAGETSITLTPFQQVRVGADGTLGEPEDLPRDEALADDWVARNLDRDDTAGFAPALDDGGVGDGDDEPVIGGDGPPAGDGQPVTAGTVLAATGGDTAVLIRPDGSTADVPLGVPQLLTADWLADGSIAYVEGGQLRRVLPDGSGTQTAAGSGYDTVTSNVQGLVAIGLRQDGTDVIRLFDGSPSGAVIFETSADLDRMQWPAVSPDGATIAAVDFQGEALLLIDVATGSSESRPAPKIDGWLRWSPDGGQVVYTVDRSGVRFAGDDPAPGIVVHDVGSGTEQRFDGFIEADFLPDGRALVAASQPRLDQPPGPLMLIDLASGSVSEFRDGIFGSVIVFDGATQELPAWGAG